MKTAKPGQKVAFAQSVLKRMGPSPMRGTVLSLHSGGKVAEVDTGGTWPNEDGNSIRFIPVANLTPILANGVIFGD
jgi:hypothetical protein